MREGIVKWHGHVDVIPSSTGRVYLYCLPITEKVCKKCTRSNGGSDACDNYKIPGCEELVKHEETGVLINQRDVSALVAG